MNRRRWIGVLLGVAAISGFFVVRSAGGPEVAIVGHPFDYKVIGRNRLTAKPWVDMKLPLFGRVTFPKVDPLAVKLASGFKPYADVSPGVIFSSKSPTIRLGHWEIDRQTGTDAASSGRYGWLPLPYVYGTESKIIRFWPYGNALPVRVRVPGNGVAAPLLKDHVVTVGSHQVRFHPRPVVSPSIPVTFEVSVENAKPDEQFFLTFGRRGRLLCGRYRGLLRLEKNYQGGLSFEFCRVEISTVALKVSRTSQGAVESVTVRLPSGEVWLRGDLTGPSAGAHFETIDSYVTVPFGPATNGPEPDRELTLAENDPYRNPPAGDGWAWRLLSNPPPTATRWRMIAPVTTAVDLELPREFPYRPLSLGAR